MDNQKKAIFVGYQLSETAVQNMSVNKQIHVKRVLQSINSAKNLWLIEDITANIDKTPTWVDIEKYIDSKILDEIDKENYILGDINIPVTYIGD